jgi:hypothetical protein
MKKNSNYYFNIIIQYKYLILNDDIIDDDLKKYCREIRIFFFKMKKVRFEDNSSIKIIFSF